jgi:hypothetical protein
VSEYNFGLYLESWIMLLRLAAILLKMAQCKELLLACPCTRGLPGNSILEFH